MRIMMIFNMSTSYFHKISFHYFEDYLMMRLILDKVMRKWWATYKMTQNQQLVVPSFPISFHPIVERNENVLWLCTQNHITS